MGYHTGFETFYLVDKLIDPGFEISKVCTEMALHMTLQLAEDPVLPYSFHHIISEVEKAFDKFETTVFTTLRQNGMRKSLDTMINAFQQMKEAILQFSGELDNFIDDNSKSALERRIMNDKLMLFERIFVLPNGLPGRPNFRHALFSPTKFNFYAGAVLPGLTDLMHDFEKLVDEERDKRIIEVKMHLSDIMIMFRQAARWLNDSNI